MILAKLLSINKKIDVKVKRVLRNKYKKKQLLKIIKSGDFYNVPIYIISFNRLDYVKQTVNWLNDCGYKNIIIIDNCSSYKPLLDYYDSCGCKVIRMHKNYGYKVFNENIRFWLSRHKGYYVLTDPDLYPIKECPNNFMEIFFKIMCENIDITKVGFSIKIDDIPDSYYLKEEVIKWESQYYTKTISNNPLAYEAYIDTTFALNAPMTVTAKKDRLKGIRVGYPYQVRHLPWYENNNSIENDVYLKTKRNDQTTWNGDKTKNDVNDWINNH